MIIHGTYDIEIEDYADCFVALKYEKPCHSRSFYAVCVNINNGSLYVERDTKKEAVEALYAKVISHVDFSLSDKGDIELLKEHTCSDMERIRDSITTKRVTPKTYEEMAEEWDEEWREEFLNANDFRFSIDLEEHIKHLKDNKNWRKVL